MEKEMAMHGAPILVLSKSLACVLLYRWMYLILYMIAVVDECSFSRVIVLVLALIQLKCALLALLLACML